MYRVIVVGFLLVDEDNSAVLIQFVLQSMDQGQDRILVGFFRICMSNLPSVDLLIPLATVWMFFSMKGQIPWSVELPWKDF